jgi:hypothetical protein
VEKEGENRNRNRDHNREDIIGEVEEGEGTIKEGVVKKSNFKRNSEEQTNKQSRRAKEIQDIQ